MKKIAMAVMIVAMISIPGCIKDAKVPITATVDFSSSTFNASGNTGVDLTSSTVLSNNTVLDLTSSSIASDNEAGVIKDNTIIVSSGAKVGSDNTFNVNVSSSAVGAFMDKLFEHMKWYHWILLSLVGFVTFRYRRTIKKWLKF